MYEFSYDYIQPKYQDKAHLCYLDADSFIAKIKTEDVYKGIVNDTKKGVHPLNYKTDRYSAVGKKSDWVNEGYI